MSVGNERKLQSITTHLERADLATRALEHAVGLMVLSSCVEGTDPDTHTKLALGMILAADLVEPAVDKGKIELISAAKSRVYQRLLFAEPDLRESIVGKPGRTRLALLRPNWSDHVGMAYERLLVDGIPRGIYDTAELQAAILEDRVDFRLPDESKAAA